jgi:hypothetical protein
MPLGQLRGGDPQGLQDQRLEVVWGVVKREFEL